MEKVNKPMQLLVILAFISNLYTVKASTRILTTKDLSIDQHEKDTATTVQEIVAKETKAEKQKKDAAERLAFLRQKAIQYFDKIELGDDKPQCNTQLLQLFGIASEEVLPFASSSDEKKYCRRNEVTCCSAENIESTRNEYIAGASKMRYLFEMLEELFVMFKGRAFGQVIFEIETNNKCQYVFEELGIDRKVFISKVFLNEKSDLLGSLLVDLEIYIKRQQWYFGNFICTICNPLNHSYFNFEGGKTIITSHASNCPEIVEIKDFEVRVAEVFHAFINPYVNIIECLNFLDEYSKKKSSDEKTVENKDEKQLNENKQIKVDEGTDAKANIEGLDIVLANTSVKEEKFANINKNLTNKQTKEIKDINPKIMAYMTHLVKETIDNLQSDEEKRELNPKVVTEEQPNIEKIENEVKNHKDGQRIPESPPLIKNINLEEVMELKSKLLICHRVKFSAKNNKCRELCTKNLLNFEFPIKYFDNVAEALSIIYTKLTEKNIDKYYQEKKKRPFTKVGNDKSIIFYKFNEKIIKEVNFENIEWQFDMESGITIFSDHMSKKYIPSNSAIIGFIGTIWITLRMLF